MRIRLQEPDPVAGLLRLLPTMRCYVLHGSADYAADPNNWTVENVSIEANALGMHRVMNSDGVVFHIHKNHIRRIV